MKLTAQNVEDILKDCFYRDEEIVDNKPPDDVVIVEGIMTKFGFHPGRLESHREEIRDMLFQLPQEFMKTGGGGMSFLNACVDMHGTQWGEHQDMDNLFCLGMALKLVTLPIPRNFWGMLPGGVPYVTVETLI